MKLPTVELREEIRIAAYYRLFQTQINRAFDNCMNLERAVLYGVRSFNAMKRERANSLAELMEMFQFAEVVLSLMTRLTPRQLVGIFPIKKVYDGERWSTKDYFSAVQAIESHGWDKLIADPIDFLWDYLNRETGMFVINHISLLSAIQRAHGHAGLMEEWAADNGISTYTMHTDQNGKQFMMDDGGRTFKVAKPRSQYLKLVKGGTRAK